MDRKKKPNMARKKTVMADVPVVNVGSRNRRTSSSGYRRRNSIKPNSTDSTTPTARQP